MVGAAGRGFVCQAQKEEETPPILSNLAAESFDVCHFLSLGKTRQLCNNKFVSQLLRILNLMKTERVGCQVSFSRCFWREVLISLIETVTARQS